MKRLLLSLSFIVVCAMASFAQKFALVDMEYILKNIPEFETANQTLNQLSQKWQKEIETKQAEADEAYEQYKADYVFLSETLKQQREEAVTAIEKQVAELRYKYFGPEGELYKQRKAKIEPIQNKIYEAIKKLAEEKGYQAIFDRASASDLIFASPKIDVSNDVLARLGYSR